VLLLVELSSPERPGWRTILRRQGAHWLLFAAGALLVLFSSRSRELVMYGFGERGLADNLLTQVGAVSYLALRLIGLQGYNIDPALPTLHAWDATLALQAAALGALAALGIANLRARPWIAFGLLWFFVQLAPTNSLVPRLDVVNDRQLYLACWGLFLALSVQIAKLAPPRRAVQAGLAALLALMTVASVARQLDYRSEIALWEASLREAPWNARAHNNLGYAYHVAGRKDEATREFRAALVFDPGYGKARLNLLLLD
jgi:tetratricopeptide (TPR) repeat protein